MSDYEPPEPKPNRSQRRSGIGKPMEKLVLKEIHITLESGKVLGLDIHKVDIIDKKSKKRLFKAEVK